MLLKPRMWAPVVVMGALLLGSVPAHAQELAPVPAPTPNLSSDPTPIPGHIATPADDVMHPGSWVEWWYVLLMDPHSKRQFIAVISSAPAPVVVGVMMYADGPHPISSTSGQSPAGLVPVAPPADDRRPGVRTSAGSISYVAARHAYHLLLSPGLLGSGYAADVWLDRQPLPGATGVIDLKQSGEWMGWTSPVATSTVDGWVQAPHGVRTSVTGWRGYHDHNWGHFTIVDQQAGGWEWGVSFEPDGGAHILGGVVRSNGQWAGSLVDARPSGTRGCAATIMKMTGWYAGSDPTTGSTYSLPENVNVQCAPGAGGASTRPRDTYDFGTTFHLVTPPFVVDDGLVAASGETKYYTVPGSFGIYEHVRTLLARIDATTTALQGAGLGSLGSLLHLGGAL